MFKKIVFGLITLVTLLGCYAGYQMLYGGFTFLDKNVVEITFSENISSYDPFSFVEANNQRLVNIYEPLVKFDENLTIQPVLVSSFGKLDDTTWEFKLKPNIFFHDNSKLTPEIVQKSIYRAKSIPAMKALTSTIANIDLVDDSTFIIKTTSNDNLLLTKLAHIFITPDISINDLIANPIGTGQYKVKKIYDEELHLIGFENYHGSKSNFQKLIISYTPDQIERVNMMEQLDNLLMVNSVPVSFADKVNRDKFQIVSTPNNAVNFFLFNFNRPYFKDLSKRKFFLKFFDDRSILHITDNQAKPTDQFVGSGVFGYNPEIIVENFADDKETLSEAKKSRVPGSRLKIAVSEDLAIFKELIEQKMFKVGVVTIIDLIPNSELLNKEKLSNYDLIFIGWKSDFGDSISFFENIAISNAGLNLGGYRNKKLDNLVTEAISSKDDITRRSLLNEAMTEVSVTNPIGIPLFESVTIYSVNKNYSYKQRLDGIIDINNFTKIQ